MYVADFIPDRVKLLDAVNIMTKNENTWWHTYILLVNTYNNFEFLCVIRPPPYPKPARELNYWRCFRFTSALNRVDLVIPSAESSRKQNVYDG